MLNTDINSDGHTLTSLDDLLDTMMRYVTLHLATADTLEKRQAILRQVYALNQALFSVHLQNMIVDFGDEMADRLIEVFVADAKLNRDAINQQRAQENGE